MTKAPSSVHQAYFRTHEGQNFVFMKTFRISDQNSVLTSPQNSPKKLSTTSMLFQIIVTESLTIIAITWEALHETCIVVYSVSLFDQFDVIPFQKV